MAFVVAPHLVAELQVVSAALQERASEFLGSVGIILAEVLTVDPDGLQQVADRLGFANLR